MNTQQLQENIDSVKAAATETINNVKQQANEKIDEITSNPKYQQEKTRVQSALNKATVTALENGAKAADFIADKARISALKAREKALKLKL